MPGLLMLGFGKHGQEKIKFEPTQIVYFYPLAQLTHFDCWQWNESTVLMFVGFPCQYRLWASKTEDKSSTATAGNCLFDSKANGNENNFGFYLYSYLSAYET